MPLVRAGNARITSTPRKRLIVPFFLTHSELSLLDDVRDATRDLSRRLDVASSTLLDRDFVDLCRWVGSRQSTVLETAAYLAHCDGRHDQAAALVTAAESTWRALQDLLATVPELSIVGGVSSAVRSGSLSPRVVQSFWTNACDFYGGYPLVLSPEAIELVYLEQLAAFRAELKSAADTGSPAALREPGWFWHDFPEKRWADVVRRLPSEDATNFEHEMTKRLRSAAAEGISAGIVSQVPPSGPSRLDPDAATRFATACLSLMLPPPISFVPSIPDAKK
jgi:hypothetical protein